MSPYIDLQLVVFPQDGVLRTPGGVPDSLKRALIWAWTWWAASHFERTMTEGAASVKLLCEIAERGLPVDMHCDESGRPAFAPHRIPGLRDPARAWALHRVTGRT